MAGRIGRTHILVSDAYGILRTACGLEGLRDAPPSEMINFIGDRRYEITTVQNRVDCRRCLCANKKASR